MGSEKSGMIKRCVAEELLKIGQRPSVGAAHNSVGLDGGIGTKSELYMLLEEHRLWTSQLEAVNKVLEEMILKVPHVEKLLAIKGVGSITIAGFIAEVGDIRRFDSPKQIQKYAGLELVENSSGKHKGRTRISKRRGEENSERSCIR